MICWFKKLYRRIFKWKNDTPDVELAPSLPLKLLLSDWTPERPAVKEALAQVHDLFNKHCLREVVKFAEDYPADSMVFVASKVNDNKDGFAIRQTRDILLRRGLTTEQMQKVYAHELGHALGHWHHGTNWMMQPSVLECLGLEQMIEQHSSWIREQYKFY